MLQRSSDVVGQRGAPKGNMAVEKESGKGGKVPATALEKLRTGVKKKRGNSYGKEDALKKSDLTNLGKKRWWTRAEQ